MKTPDPSEPKIMIRRWQFGGELPYDAVNLSENRVIAHLGTAQQCFDYFEAVYPGESVTVDIRP